MGWWALDVESNVNFPVGVKGKGEKGENKIDGEPKDKLGNWGDHIDLR